MTLGEIFIKLGLKSEGFEKGIDNAKQKTNVFAEGIKKLGTMLVAIFAVDKLIEFGKELFNIAKEAEGVSKAFYKIASTSDLKYLKDSVRGTVSELELMKRAVQANNFGIPVRELGDLFAFATKRAQDTGQSVDYLVDSIVTGIGRKSPLILDNLGISAIQLKQKLNGVGLETASVGDITRAVGQIAKESFQKTGEIVETVGIKAQRLSATWDNMKEKLSGLFSNSEGLKKDLDSWSQLFEIWQSKEVSRWEKFWSSISKVSADANYKAMKEAEAMKQWLNPKEQESVDNTPKTGETAEQRIATLKRLIAETKAMMTKKNVEASLVVGWNDDLKKMQEELDILEPKNEKIHKSYQQQLADIQEINKELEAKQKLESMYKGGRESVTAATTITNATVSNGSERYDTKNLSGIPEYQKLMKDKYDKLIEPIKNFNEELNSVIAQGMQSAAETFGEGIGALMSGDMNMKDFGKSLLVNFGNFLKEFGKLMIAYALAAANLDITMKNPALWPLGLAAGIALIAIGSAISNAGAKGVAGLSNSSGGGTSSGSSGYSGTSNTVAANNKVVFEIKGTSLVGVLNNVDRKNTLIR